MILYGSNIELVEEVTPSDTADLTNVAVQGGAQSIYVGASGDVVVTTAPGDVTFVGMAAGVWHPMPPYSRVKATGTTATGIIAGY